MLFGEDGAHEPDERGSVGAPLSSSEGRMRDERWVGEIVQHGAVDDGGKVSFGASAGFRRVLPSPRFRAR